MTAENIPINISGLPSGEQALRTASIVILCGVSGNTAIPLRCDSNGNLYTSGV